ncbi:hypothetical protein [Phycicoccus flavus]|uniref:hypothetical protein n=1 Tax=Phycicoccus flavus TaxID=2502783 RepID=UPI000FEB632F|nr:hypothetical protein [Phycicoccus flavus]NHA66982.1 hypothetical protein [Phycicoccus flavus]
MRDDEDAVADVAPERSAPEHMRPASPAAPMTPHGLAAEPQFTHVPEWVSEFRRMYVEPKSRAEMRERGWRPVRTTRATAPVGGEGGEDAEAPAAGADGEVATYPRRSDLRSGRRGRSTSTGRGEGAPGTGGEAAAVMATTDQGDTAPATGVNGATPTSRPEETLTLADRLDSYGARRSAIRSGARPPAPQPEPEIEGASAEDGDLEPATGDAAPTAEADDTVRDRGTGRGPDGTPPADETVADRAPLRDDGPRTAPSGVDGTAPEANVPDGGPVLAGPGADSTGPRDTDPPQGVDDRALDPAAQHGVSRPAVDGESQVAAFRPGPGGPPASATPAWSASPEEPTTLAPTAAATPAAPVNDAGDGLPARSQAGRGTGPDDRPADAGTTSILDAIQPPVDSLAWGDSRDGTAGPNRRRRRPAPEADQAAPADTAAPGAAAPDSAPVPQSRAEAREAARRARSARRGKKRLLVVVAAAVLLVLAVATTWWMTRSSGPVAAPSTSHVSAPLVAGAPGGPGAPASLA